jgi:hypothetical protein
LNRKIDNYLWWALFAIVALIVIGIRVRLLGIPLERDEGEYAYAGQLMLQGIPPYQLAYNMKFPGTYAAYALIMSIFGQSPAGVHLGLLFVNAATVAMIFFLGRRLLGEIGGIAAAASYAIMSVSPTVLGFAGHATHFVVFFAVAGMLLLLRALATASPSSGGQDRQSHALFFVSGILLGLAVIMKQPGIFFLLFGLTFLLVRSPRPWRSIALFICGAVVPFVVTCALLRHAGVFDKFWFWSITYARQYGTRVSLPLAVEVFASAFPRVAGSSGGFWILALIGFLLSLWRLRSQFFVPLFLFFSALALSAGFYFRQHYFILVLPALALLVGMTMSILQGTMAKRVVTLSTFIAALALPLYAERDFFFELSMDEVSRLTSGMNPFPESQRLAEFLRERTSPNDTIAVLGSEPQIYFLAQRHSATGYIYMYPLMEPQPFAAQMQQEMIREIENAWPKFVVFVSIQTSWLTAPESERAIFDWFEKYSAAELKPAGLVNMISPTQTDYYLPYAGEIVTPSPARLTIYERKL